MNDTLFDIPEQKSPRLLWIEKHGIEIITNFYDEWEDTQWPFLALAPTRLLPGQYFGNTEDEALIKLAIAGNLKLWNQ